MGSISDEAVQAATRAFLGTPPLMDGWEPAIRAALEAAQPIMMRKVIDDLMEIMRIKDEVNRERIVELEDAVLEVISAQENGPLRQATLNDPHMDQMRRRLWALLPDDDRYPRGEA